MVLLLATALSGATDSGEVRTPLQHQMYIWQRAWTDRVSEAMEHAAPYVSGWRVLVAETDRRGEWRFFLPLPDPTKSLTAVIRIDGQRRLEDASAVTEHVLAWARAQPAGRWSGIEIDYDCPTRQLRTYTRLLESLRSALPPDTRLSLTALPTWIGSPDLPDLLSTADESVLQVHSVLDPRRGLFVGSLAVSWTTSYSRITHKPFSVALPDYGSRVAWDSTGKLASVLSEQSGIQTSPVQKELEADPTEVAAFLENLRATHPRNLTSIVWFRLPVADDRRIWSLEALETVIEARPLTPRLNVDVERDNLGAYRVILSNSGTADMTLPRTIKAKPCVQADALPGYTLRHGSDDLVFTARGDSKLRVGQQVTVGWTRCAINREDLSLED